MTDTWTPSAAFAGATSGQSGGSQLDPTVAYYQDIGNRVKVLTQTSPWLANQPDALMALAQDPGLDTFDLATQSAAMTGRMRVDALSQSLGSMSPAAQRMVWSKLTGTQQQALRDMGYNTPSQDGGGPLDFLGPVGSVAGAGFGALGTVAGTVASPLLEGLTWVGDQPAHLFRTVATMDETAQVVGLAAGFAAAVGIAASPFTGGLSLGLTALASGTAGLVAANAAAAGTSALQGNPTDWWDAYNSTWDGEKVFTREAQMKARELLGDDPLLVNVAADIGWNDDTYDLLTQFASEREATSDNQLLRSIDKVARQIVDPADPRYAEVTKALVKLTGNPNFREAVQVLQDGKISFGRSLANRAGLSPNSGLYNIVSGTTDGLWLVAMDPTLAAGHVGQWNKARRFGVEIIDNTPQSIARVVQTINETPAIARHYDFLADAVNAGDFTAVKRTLPGSQPIWGDLVAWRNKLANEGRLGPEGFTRKDITNWIEQGSGYEMLLRGRSAVQGESKLLLPTLSRTGVQWARAKNYTGAVINFADDNNSIKAMRKIASEAEHDLRVTQTAAVPEAVLAGETAQPVFRTGQRSVAQADQYARTRQALEVIDRLPVLGKIERSFGALAGSMTNMIPPTRSISLIGPSAATDIDKFVDLGRVMGMTSDTRNAWRNFILDQANPGLRASAIESYLDTLLKVTGVDALPDGQRLIDRFLTKYHHSYALGGTDELVIGGRTRNTGVLPLADQAVELVMPDLRELRRAVQKGTVLHMILDAADAKWVDAAMSKVWKPAVLLRIGFIPRAAGEELLALMARTGVSQLVAEMGQASVAQGRLADPAHYARVTGREFITDAERDLISHWRVAAHVRPIERMMARYDWSEPGVKYLERYSRWLRSTLESGLLSDGLVARMSDNTRTKILGNERGLRRLLLSGVDENVQEAVQAFQGRFARSIMREVSASNAGMIDPGIQRNVVKYLVPDGEGMSEQAYVMSRGTWRAYDKGDWYYNTAVHHQMQRALGDPIVAQAVIDPYTRVRPRFVDLDEDTAAGMARMWADIDPDGPVGRIVREGLDGAPLTGGEYDRLLDEIGYHLGASQMDEFLAILPTSNATADEIIDALVTVGGGNADEFRAAVGLLDSLDGLGAESRGWAAAFIEHGRWTRDDLNNMSGWFVDADKVDEMVRTNIAALLTDPRYGEALRTSMFAVETPTGAVVRNPLPDDVVRLYQPTLTQDDLRTMNNVAGNAARQVSAAAPEDQAELLDVLAGDILQGWGIEMQHLTGELQDAYDVVHDFTKAMILRAGDGTLDDMLRTAQSVGHVPLSFYGFDDPEIAKAISFYIKRRGRRSLADARNSPVAYVDFDRSMRAGKLREVTKRTNTGARNGWVTDHSAIAGRSNIVPADAQFEQLGGQWVHGTSVEQSAQEWSGTILERINQIVRSQGSNEMYAAKPLRYEVRRKGRRVSSVEVQPGERLVKDRVYFDVESGQTVNWSDRRFMSMRETSESNGRLMFEMVGPALRDAGDEITNRVLHSPAGERIFRSKVDQVANSVAADLPDQALDVALKPVKEGTWDKMVRVGFDEVISPAIDAIVRTPMAQHYWIDSYTQARKAYRWLLDGDLIDQALPARLGQVFSGYAADGGDDFMRSVRDGIRLFDDDLVDATDTQIARYLSDLDDAELDRLKARARHRLAQGDPDAARQVAAINAIRNADPDLLALYARGDDPNLAFARMLIDKVGPSINQSWKQASRHRRIQDLMEQYPEFEREMANGGWELIRQARDNIEHVDQLVGDIAVERTVSSVMPFLDSHEIKSQFSEYGRNLLPFWYAEENFIKRWTRTLRIAPEALRKGQLTYMGMKEVGVVRTDAQGRDWFVYPGSGPFIDALGKVPGLGAMPVGAMLQAETKNMLPGFNRFGQPSPSPLVMVPTTVVSQMFPELRPLHEAVAGQDGLYRGVARQVIPTTAMRAWEAFFASPENSTSYASAMMSAIAYMEAAGNGIDDNATPEQVDDFMRRAEKHARTIMFAKAIAGFVVPGSPQNINTGDPSWMQSFSGIGVDDPAQVLRDEYYTLIRQAGIEDGTARYLEQFPDHGLEDIVNPLAVTVSQSETPSGARLPATEQAVAFYDDHSEWMTSMPNAGPWLLPPDQDSTDAGDAYAYTRQTIDGLRKRRTPDEYLRAIKFKEGSIEYFRAMESKDKIIAAATEAGDETQARLADEMWSQWSDIYLAQHPVFNEELQGSEGRLRRQRVLDEMRVAVADPEAPRAWHFEETRVAVEMFDAYQGAVATLRMDRTNAGREQLARVKAGYEQVMAEFLLKYPHLEPFWLSILRPEASL